MGFITGSAIAGIINFVPQIFNYLKGLNDGRIDHKRQLEIVKETKDTELAKSRYSYAEKTMEVELQKQKNFYSGNKYIDGASASVRIFYGYLAGIIIAFHVVIMATNGSPVLDIITQDFIQSVLGYFMTDRSCRHLLFKK